MSLCLVSQFIYCYAECYYAECHCGECCGPVFPWHAFSGKRGRNCLCALRTQGSTLIDSDLIKITRAAKDYNIDCYFNEGISAASFCHQVETWFPDMFCSFYLVKHRKIDKNSTTTKAREKMKADLEL
jgi:hypothetical protein